MQFIHRRTTEETVARLIEKAARIASAKGTLLGFADPRSDPALRDMAGLAYDLGAKAYAGGWVQLQNWQDLGIGPASVNSFTTTTCILSPAPRPFIPANSVQIGTRFRLRAWGSIANSGSTTFTIGVAWNGTGGTPIIASATGTPGAGPLPFWFEAELTVLQIGAASTASIIGQGIALGLTATPTTPVLVPATAPTALSTTFATTAAWNLTANSVCGSSAAGNAFVTYGHTVEQLN